MNRFVAVGLMAALVLGVVCQSHADERIQASIAAAVKYLKTRHGTEFVPNNELEVGENESGAYAEGPAALAGLALMESGIVAPNDPAIMNIAARVRHAAIRQHQTYQLSLNIMFLDKLGTPLDTELIQSMAVRLLLGQTPRGGWSYRCRAPDDQEIARLKQLVSEAKPAAKNDGSPVGADIDSRPRLSDAVADILKSRRLLPPSNGANPDGMDDNSNTQFAILGLWAARRHGVPVDDALAFVEKRFLAAQDPRSGGWGYGVGGFVSPTPPMTCVGLLALAISSGNNSERVLRAGAKPKVNPDGKVTEPKDIKPPKISNPLESRSVQAGLAYIAPFIAPPAPKQGQGAVAPSLPGAGVGTLGDWMSDLYFLWTLERVCMVYGLKDIHRRDWYAIGSKYLMESQNHDGSWRHKYSPEIETSFGLMFMCRSNLVKDLTRILRAGNNLPKTASGGPAVKPGGNANIPPPAGNTSTGDADVAELTKSLLEAKGAEQARLLEKLRDEKGAAYTSALVDAIPKLSKDMQKSARDALAERMSRMKPEFIQDRLQNENPELRRAAAIAVYMRDLNDLIPDVIPLLADKDELVWRGARLVLTKMTGKDFGPPPQATDEEKKTAVAAWKAWYKEQKK